MAQYGEDLVNEFAPRLWEFTAADCPSVGVRLPPVHSIMWNISVRRVFQSRFSDENYSLFRQYARRVFYAAKAYSGMRRNLIAYFTDFSRDCPKLNYYFAALGEAEVCILNLHIMLDAHIGLGTDVLHKIQFPESKVVNDFANNIKHLAGQINGKAFKERKFLPIFFVNDGLTNGKSLLRFSEIQKLVFGNARVLKNFYSFSG